MAPLRGQYLDPNGEEKYILSGKSSGFLPDPKGLGHTFFQCMSRNRHLVAQIDAISGVKDMYGNLLERCINTAIEMQKKGIKPKDIITICSTNQLNSCVPIIAALFIGAIPACLDPMLSLSDTVYLLKQVTPKFAFVDETSLQLIEAAFLQANVNAVIVLFGVSEQYLEFRDFVTSNATRDFAPYETSDNKETAIILFSSGSTGMPKGICLSHRGLLGQGNILVSEGIGLEITLLYASYYWISAIILLTSSVLLGGCRLVAPLSKPEAHWKLLDKFKVTCSFLAPSHAIAVYKHGRPESTNTTYLKDLMIGGGPLSAYHLQEIREIFPGTNCNIVYGQTECTGLVLNFNRLDRKEVMLMYAKPGSTGLICPDFSIKVVDSETNAILGPNQKGELCFKSNYIMNGYYNMDSTSVWYPDGWLRSGDIGYFDEDLCFYIVDRIKEMLKFQSYHIPPSVVESILMTHPKIRSAAVIGIPNDEDGDHPLGVVCLKDSEENITEAEIIKYVDERVDDRYRLRGGVIFLKELPFTATGKIRRNFLKGLVLDGKM